MARDPYSWADQVGRDGQAAITNAQSREQNALMNIFQEEAARQRPYVTMPANLAESEFNRQNAEPYQIRQEQRGLQNDMAMRRYYAENPIPRATTDGDPTVLGGAAPVDNGDGTLTVIIGGKPVIIDNPAG